MILTNTADKPAPVASPVVRKAPAITDAVSEYIMGTRLRE